MVPEIKPQPFDIESHLHHITRRWGEIGQPVMVELVFLSAEDKAEVKHVARYRPDQIGQAADDAAAMNALGINVYCAINPIDANNQPKAGHRASREHIVGAFYHWADADDAQAAENIRNFVGPKCTMHVLTGTQPCMRPHVYWELVEFTRNLPEWETRQKAIAATLGTDPKVTDAPRIMRLAGSINWPKPAKRAKGYIAEVTTLRVYDPLERPPVSAERMARAFVGVAAGAAAGGLQIDTGMGANAMDRALATAQIKAGENWRGNVMSLVASYIARGWTDDEILDRCEPFTLPGYTVADTREDVAGFILWTRNQEARSGGRYATSPVGVQGQTYAPNFDHAPAPTPSDPAPSTAGWRVQNATEFVEGFVAPEYLIDGVVQRGRLYTLTAPTGSGKTAVMLYIATAMSQGMPVCDRETECGDVLYLAGENPDDVRARVIATLDQYGHTADATRLHFIPGTFSIRADMDALKAALAKLPNCILVVVDTLAAYFDGDDSNSNAQMLDFARMLRRIIDVPSRPAVIVPAHPVKNAIKTNLTPMGGSALLNEVDGNLCLWKRETAVELHWQGKHRGAEFDPLNFELVGLTSEKVRDSKGRLMPTVMARPLMEMRAMQIATDRLSAIEKLILNIEQYEAQSIRQRCVEIGMVTPTGKAKTSSMANLLGKLAEEKLARRILTNWELTPKGQKAADMIKNGGKFAEDLE